VKEMLDSAAQQLDKKPNGRKVSIKRSSRSAVESASTLKESDLTMVLSKTRWKIETHSQRAAN